MSRYLPSLVIALLAATVYWVTLSFEFVLDDIIHIVENKNIIDGSKTFVDIFSSPIEPGNLYRPLLILSYRLTHDFFGLIPGPFHLTNIILHLLNCIFLYLLARKIPSISHYSWLAVAIFAVHPIHVEAVANISGRSELLCHFFGLLAALFLTSSNLRLRELSLGTVCLTLSLFTKESGVSYFLLIPLISWYRGFSLKAVFRAIALPASISLCFYSYFRIQALGGVFAPNYVTEPLDNPLVVASFIDRIFTALYVLGYGFYKTIFPVALSADYSLNQMTTLKPGSSAIEFATVVCVIATFAYSILKIRDRNIKGLLGTWVLASLLVTSNLIFISGTIFGERHLYLSSFALCILFSWALTSIHQPLLRVSLSTLLICTFSFKTFKETWLWSNFEALFSGQVARAPQSAKSYNNFGSLLMQRGNNLLAIQYFEKSLSIYPNSQMGNLWLGRIHKHIGKRELARNYYESALNVSPDDPEVLLEMGRLFLEDNNKEQAQLYFDLLKTKHPKNLFTAIADYLILKNNGETKAAEELFVKMIAHEPKNYILIELKNGSNIRH